MNETLKPVLLMLGDSLIDYGEWDLRLKNYRVISSGVPGERTEHLLHRLPRCLPGNMPEAITIMSGTNNIVFGDLSFIEVMHHIIALLQDHFNRPKIILTSLLPYELPTIIDVIHSANERLQLICENSGCHYLDLCSEFEHSFKALFDYDGVHLSNEGYRLWAALLDGELRKLLAKAGD